MPAIKRIFVKLFNFRLVQVIQNHKRILTCALLLLPFNYSYAVEPLGCLIEPSLVAEVGSPVIGVINTVNVERGDIVRQGQKLATLRADVERAYVDVAKTRGQAEAEVRSAEAVLNLARITQKRQESLRTKNFISQHALDKAYADTAVAEQKLAENREQLRTWKGELSLARAQLDQRTIRSPIDGIIAERYVWPGERVEEKPLFKVVKIDPLRVIIVAPASLYGSVDKDMSLVVTPLLAKTSHLQAKVTLVDKLIDGASNTFRIQAEIPNQKSLIPSGIRCTVQLPDPATSNTSDISASRNIGAVTATNAPMSLPNVSSVNKPKKINQSNHSKQKSDAYLIRNDIPKNIDEQPIKLRMVKSLSEI
jgi:RND family efflux transporter MFP subunit